MVSIIVALFFRFSSYRNFPIQYYNRSNEFFHRQCIVEFVDFIESLPGGSTRGVDKPMYAKDIKAQVSHAQSLCK